MTDDERMDRATRIREMREGSRDGGDEESSSETTEENRTDGGDPEKQTMEDIVEAADDERGDSDAGGDDDGGVSDTESTATEDDKPSEDTVDTATREENEPQPTETGAGAQEMTPTMGESEPTTAETGSTADTDDRAASADDRAASADDRTANTDTGAADEGGVSAPLPEMDELEQALDGSATADPETVATGMADSGGGGAATAAQMGAEAGPADAGMETADTVGASATDEAETTEEEETRVLEFTLDDEHYCLDIQYIEEIVKHENITRVPNTPGHVEGVVDLRGQITTILNPKVTIGKENDEAGELIVVFDAEAFEDQGYIGWVVDDVRQVSPIVESEVNDPPMAEDYINGVIDREDDDEFVIWTSPDLAFEDED